MEQLAFTALLNRLFGPAVTALLVALHIPVKHRARPISNSVAMEILVVLLHVFVGLAHPTHRGARVRGGAARAHNRYRAIP